MKNLMKKIRKSNKGFTLVELIIVVAIIAVLSAVVAPQYIKYVERSRQGVDASTLQEVKHIVEVEAGTIDGLTASEVTITVTNKTGAISGTNSFASAAGEGGTDAAALTNVKNTAGTLTFKSAKANDTYVLSVADTGVVTWKSGTDAKIAALTAGNKAS